ncbi:hypothetical protein F5Y19DRAFT_477790 [Xylariaceae sp. FL1651]|nr:hypothetical protein F5Y19DRAFT_477790 [Xylariaceae sp. FL1651]
MQHGYRPLLPAPGHPYITAPSSSSGGNSNDNDNNNGSGGGGRGPGHDSPDRSKRRNPTQPSCNLCRARKTRCDRERPKCSTCQRRGTECIYRDKTELDDEHSEILDALQSLPERHAFNVLRSLRTAHDVTAALNMVRRRTEPAEGPSEHNHARRMGVAAQSPFEFELTTCYPTAYVPLTPVSASVLAGSNLLRPVSQARIPSPLEDSGSITPSQNQTQPVDGSPATPPPGIDADSAIKLFRAKGHLTAPLPVQHFCDDRLRSLQIGFWTDVPVTNDFAARVLSLYLTTDHPLLGVFDPQRFIADLVGQQQTFCSRFLVHALLYWGCQMYSAIDKSAYDVADAFCEGAERLWQVEKSSDSLLNMAGAQLMSLAHMGHGKDGVVLYYLAEGVRMGMRLCLLGVDETAAWEKARTMPDEMRTASSFAAWGVFNWAVLSSLFYRQPGLECPAFPPVLPTPGNMSTAADTTSTRTNISPLPWYMGDIFSALCKFWEIIHGLILTWQSDQKHPLQNQSELDFAEFKYRELLAWAENLPSSLVRSEDNPHHVVILHMWLHCAIVDIFRPFITSQPLRQAHLKTFTHPSPPAAAYSASIEQLKGLIIAYRSNYEASTYTILWHTALLYVANAVLQDTKIPEWRIYFLLCIYGYESLRRPYRISAVVVQSLLTMTLRDGNISGAEAREIVKQLKQRGLSSHQENIRATFMADLNLAATDAEAAKVENLAARFEEMALFQDFINMDGDNSQMDLS